MHEAIDTGWADEIQEDVWRSRFVALSEAEAQKWIMTGEVEIFHNPFEEPPEATAETEASATAYVRLPASLKMRMDQAAAAAGKSFNAWATQCFEACLGAPRPKST